MKRMLSVLLAAVLAVSAAGLGAVPAAAYEDGGVRLSDWAVDSYHMANEDCILNWFCRGGDFTAPVTRAEFCDMLWNAMRGAKNDLRPDVGYDEPFPDTDRESVYALAQLGVLETGGCFAPEETLTREQAAVWIARAGAVLDFTWLPEARAAFTDAAEVSGQAAGAVAQMQSAGLMVGTDAGAFLPKAALTREQAAAVLVRFLEKNGFNYGISVRDTDGTLTLSDLAHLHGKYRALDDGAYEITYRQGLFAALVVTVRDGALVRALYTDLGSGASADLRQQSREAFYAALPDTGRYYLGGSAWLQKTEDAQRLELDGRTVLTLPEDAGGVGLCTVRGADLAYASRAGETTFYSLADGRALFTVEGCFSALTNRYLITEAYRYAAPTVDAAYTVYAVYRLDGTPVAPMGLSDAELYAQGFVTDW